MSKKEQLFARDLILESEDVILRAVKPNDFEAYRNLVFDKRIWKYFTSELSTDNDLENWLMDCISDRDAGVRAAFSIINKKTEEITGSSSFGNISFRDGRLEIGWSWINPKFQKTGMNRNAKFLLMDFAFETLNMVRVEFKTDILNEQARKGLLGINCTEEGVLRSHTLMPKGRRRDTIFYSVLKDEWAAAKVKAFPNYKRLT
jgi:RimJ/RimL family protein N-acetyltransferase